MKPIPVAFHIGPLEVHTYGIGLAVTFWFAFRYFERRLGRRGYPTGWLAGTFLWVIVAAVVGARVFHVLANLSYYQSRPADVLAVWQGGLSSFGGIIFALPTGLYLARRRCPTLTLARTLDIVAPVLMAAWALGRLLGPQLMVAGGGHPTNQWFGMYYADQVGKRLPVPIFQALEDLGIFLVLIFLERRLERWPDGRPRTGYPPGAVIGTAMVFWGIERFLDERLWLAEGGHLGSVLVQIAGVALALAGGVVLVVARGRWAVWLGSEAAAEQFAAAGAPTESGVFAQGDMGVVTQGGMGVATESGVGVESGVGDAASGDDGGPEVNGVLGPASSGSPGAGTAPPPR